MKHWDDIPSKIPVPGKTSSRLTGSSQGDHRSIKIKITVARLIIVTSRLIIVTVRLAMVTARLVIVMARLDMATARLAKSTL